MRRKKWMIIVCCIVAFLAYAMFTGGGLAISNSHDFNGQSDILLVTDLEADVWLAPRFTNWCIPFVCHYYGTSAPYGLRLQIWDTSKSYASIEITEIVLKHADGEVVRKTDKWERELRPYTQYNSSSSGLIETEMMMLSDTVDDLVVRHTDVTVTIKGHLLKSDGQEVDFSASETFEAQNGFRVTTFWEVMAGV